MLKNSFYFSVLLFGFLLMEVSASAQINFYSQMDITLHPSGYRMVTNCAHTKAHVWTDPT
jgi:hypothetical protein